MDGLSIPAILSSLISHFLLLDRQASQSYTFSFLPIIMCHTSLRIRICTSICPIAAATSPLLLHQLSSSQHAQDIRPTDDIVIPILVDPHIPQEQTRQHTKPHERHDRIVRIHDGRFGVRGGRGIQLVVENGAHQRQAHSAAEWHGKCKDAGDLGSAGGEVGQAVHGAGAHAYADAETGQGHHAVDEVQVADVDGVAEDLNTDGGRDGAEHEWVDGLSGVSVHHEHGAVCTDCDNTLSAYVQALEPRRKEKGNSPPNPGRKYNNAVPASLALLPCTYWK